MKALYARELLSELLSSREIKLLEIVLSDEDPPQKVKELLESKDLV